MSFVLLFTDYRLRSVIMHAYVALRICLLEANGWKVLPKI